MILSIFSSARCHLCILVGEMSTGIICSFLFFSEKNVYYLLTWLHWVLVVVGVIFSCGMWDLVL